MLIIPDIHGRDFWKIPVKRFLGKEHIIVLGDYLDPYEDEGISPQEAFLNFKEIVALKREYPDCFSLLLGNHDLHYMSKDLFGSRYDYASASIIKKFINDNSSVFELAHLFETGEKKYLFTHAGLRKGWIKKHAIIFEDDAITTVAEMLNNLWHDTTFHQILFSMLSDIPFSRWGYSKYGSPIWNDIDDMASDLDEFPGWYQVFGHSQQESEPVIREHFACLDCRRAFILNIHGKFQELE